MSKVDNTQQMLRMIINNLSAFKQELLRKMEGLDKKLNKKIDSNHNELTERMDKLGKQLAYLEDVAPTREEFGKLEKRFDKLEQKPSAST